MVGVSELWGPGTTGGKLSRSIWRNKADAILKSLGLFTYGGQLEPMPFCILSWSLKSGR